MIIMFLFWWFWCGFGLWVFWCVCNTWFEIILRQNWVGTEAFFLRLLKLKVLEIFERRVFSVILCLILIIRQVLCLISFV